jgi:predicted DNA-binding transcriptional regulator AlpA
VTSSSRRPPPRLSQQRAKPTPAAAPAEPPMLLGRADLREHYGITYSRAHFHRLMREGRFPRQVALGPEVYARKAWHRSDIETWLAALPYTTNKNEAA